MQWNVTVLHGDAHAARELVPAFPAQQHARLRSPAHPGHPFGPAARATRPAGPTHGLNILTSRILVEENQVPGLLITPPHN